MRELQTYVPQGTPEAPRARLSLSVYLFPSRLFLRTRPSPSSRCQRNKPDPSAPPSPPSAPAQCCLVAARQLVSSHLSVAIGPSGFVSSATPLCQSCRMPSCEGCHFQDLSRRAKHTTTTILLLFLFCTFLFRSIFHPDLHSHGMHFMADKPRASCFIALPHLSHCGAGGRSRFLPTEYAFPPRRYAASVLIWSRTYPAASASQGSQCIPIHQ